MGEKSIINQTFKKCFFFSCAVLLLLTFWTRHTFPFSSLYDGNLVEMEILSHVENPAPGEVITLAAILTPTKKWHIYWKNPGDSGLPTTFKWETNGSPVEVEALFPTPARITLSESQSTSEKGTQFINYGYEGKTVFFFKLLIPDNTTHSQIKLTCKASWLACKEECIPGSKEITLTLPLRKIEEPPRLINKEVFSQGNYDHLPQSIKGKATFFQEGKALIIHVDRFLEEDKKDLNEIKEAYFFVEEKDWVTHSKPQEVSVENTNLALRIPLNTHKDLKRCRGVLWIKDKNGTTYSYTLSMLARETIPTPQKTHPSAGNKLEATDFYWMLMLAFLGGIILNIMPCVFPILSLKAISFSHEKSSYAEGIAYTLGVLTSFLILGIAVITLKGLGHNLGWGFQMQSPLFISILMYVMFMIALNLCGFFEITWMPGAKSHASQNNHFKGSFLTGVLTTAVATPCTAPFMATAIGYALTQNNSIIILFVFLSLGLGVAFPMLLLSLVPFIRRMMPSPGKWMEIFKKILSLPMYATTLWLIWVLSQEIGDWGWIYGIGGILILSTSIWMYQKLKPKKTTQKMMWGILTMAVASIPLWFISKNPTPIKTSALSQESTVPYSKKALEELLKEDKPVFVYATAAWCLTCKFNEIFLSSHSIAEEFTKRGIAVMKADWTNHDEEITQFLTQFQRQGVPLYVYYPKGGEKPIILPQLLTQSIILEHLDEKNRSS